MTQGETQQASPMTAEPQKEHRWLEKFVGKWTYETGPDTPPQERASGSERGRSLGLWVVVESEGQMPDGKPATTVLTLGYDPEKQKFIGTWIGSMMTYLWVYEGELDAGERVLTLECKGPRFDGTGGTAQYRDVSEFVGDDHRVLRSYIQNDDGKWQQIVEMQYRRAK